MLQQNSPDNNNCIHLVRKLSKGLSRGESPSDIYKRETSKIYGETPNSTMMYGSTLEYLNDPSKYKANLNIQNQRRSFSGMNPSRIPTASIYDRRPYNSNNSTNGSEN